MNDAAVDVKFAMDFINYYPFDRYIFTNPKPIEDTFEQLKLKELFTIYDSDFNIGLLLEGPCGEVKLSYWDFDYYIRVMIRVAFIEDLGNHEYECLYVDYEDNETLISKLMEQKNLLLAKYNKCNVKETPSSNLIQ